MKIKVLDYILDNDDNFWIIKKISKNELFTELVFEVSSTGRYNKITKKKYIKVINKCINKTFKLNEYKKIFSAANYNKELLKDKWSQLIDLLIAIGIKENEIGVFGSSLIGFDIEKDVDFVVYGKRSFKLLKKHINEIRKSLNVTAISQEHIEYQTHKYKNLYNENNDLPKILVHNWVGIQFGKGVLSTIRFIKENRHYFTFSGEEEIIEGIVIEDEGTNFIPRVGVIDTIYGKVKVITYFWMFNAFLKKGEKIKIRGIYNSEKKELYLTNKNHCVKYY